MPKLSLRRLLSRLTAIALSTSPAMATAASDPPARRPCLEADLEAELEAELPIDRECLGPDAAAAALGRGLALALTDFRPLSATHVVATWAMSEDRTRRLAIAHALEWSFPVVGDAVAIDHLSRDPDPAIRAAAARAAWFRRATGGDLGVLARLTDDPDPAVRAIAASVHPML